MENKILINLKDIYFGYPDSIQLFNGLSLTVKSGDRVGIVGPNGCGKTTLFNIIMGFSRPEKGSIVIFGKERKKEKDFFEVRKKIGYLFQNSDDQLFCPSVREEVAFGPLNYRLSKDEVEKRIVNSLKIVGLAGFEERAPYHLSAGEKKKLAIATLLAMESEVLLFDEPTNELDEPGIRSVIEILHNNFTYLLISQDLNFLKKTVDIIYTIDNGRLKEFSIH